MLGAIGSDWEECMMSILDMDMLEYEYVMEALDLYNV